MIERSHLKTALLFLCVALIETSCSLVYYSAMQHLGKQKRDILVQRILEAKKDQEATKEQLKTTLQAFQEVTGFKGGNLEKTYNRLNKEYERSAGRAHKLENRIDSIDRVAKDMFSEWQSEIGNMQNPKLKRQSELLLRNARQQHIRYMKQMRRTEASIQPVLQAFSDQVVFLKHNLNARAIKSLSNTSAQIDEQAATLLADVDASSREADAYIQTLSSADSD